MGKNENLIKSLLFSDRMVTIKNISYEDLKIILNSDSYLRVVEKHTVGMKKLLVFYKEKLIKDFGQERFYEFGAEVLNIQQEKENTLYSGDYEAVAYSRLKTLKRDKELEETFKDRGYHHIRIKNDSLIVKISDRAELKYMLRMMELDAINNIITKCEYVDSEKISEWFYQLKKYAKETYKADLRKEQGRIFIGASHLKKEECFLYLDLTTSKICVIKRYYLKY